MQRISVQDRQYHRFEGDFKINLDNEISKLSKKEFCSILEDQKISFRVISHLNSVERAALLVDSLIRLLFVLFYLSSPIIPTWVEYVFYSCVLQTMLSFFTLRTQLYENQISLFIDIFFKLLQLDSLFLLNDMKRYSSTLVKDKSKVEGEYASFQREISAQLYLKKIFIALRCAILISVFIPFTSPTHAMLLHSKASTSPLSVNSYVENNILKEDRDDSMTNDTHTKDPSNPSNQSNQSNPSNQLNEREHQEHYNKIMMSILFVICQFVSLVVLNNISTKLFDVSERSEWLSLLLENVICVLQSMINIYLICCLDWSVYFICFLAISSTLWYALQRKYSGLFFGKEGLLETLFLGKRRVFLHPLIKGDYRQLTAIEGTVCEWFSRMLSVLIQSLLIFQVLSLNETPLLVVQIKVLVIEVLLTLAKGFFGLQHMSRAKQCVQVELMSEISNVSILKGCKRVVGIRVKSEQSAYLSEEDCEVLSVMVERKIHTFYLEYEKEFSLLSRRGHSYLQINRIRNSDEINRLILSLLKSSCTFDFEIDKDLVSLSKLNTLYFMLLKQCIFQEQMKLVLSQSSILHFLNPLHIPFQTVTEKYSNIIPILSHLFLLQTRIAPHTSFYSHILFMDLLNP